MNDTIHARAVLFVDGPNIDATLGNGVLGRKPAPHERARWNRVIQIARSTLDVGESWFVLNGDNFGLDRTSFYRCLKHIGYKVATPMRSEWCQNDGDDPVDEWIKHHIVCAAPKVGRGEVSGVVVLTHDGGFATALKGILDAGGSVTIVGFLEWLAPELTVLRTDGAVLLDLEHDVGAFDVRLNRPAVKAD